MNNDIFSGVPSLNDVQGLEDYLNNENLRQIGLGTDPQNPLNNGQEPNSNAGNSAQETPTQGQDSGQPQGVQYTSDQVNQLIQQVQSLQAQLAQQQQQQIQHQQIQRQVAQPQPTGYSAQQRQFINEALNRGYSMEQIMDVLNKRTAQNQAQAQINQRLDKIDEYLRTQEYKRAESEFISRLSAFGDKWGLSEQDLVTFGTEAYKKGINIANVTDLDTVFRAVYPSQYAIRSQRMNNTNTSQIYGGSSIPESSRVNAAKAEDAYVDAFFKQTMPNQYNNFKK